MPYKLLLMNNFYADRVAIKIVGDFNAQLPRSNVLVNNWHRSKGFTPYSRLLNDLIYGNNLKVIDHEFKQDVKYTYFNIPRQIYTLSSTRNITLFIWSSFF